MKSKGWIILGTALGLTSLTLFLLTIRKKRQVKPFVFDPNASTEQKVKNYLEWITPVAKRLGKKHGIPYQAMVVQTALETGWGSDSLSSKAFNFGGIKAVGNQPYIELKTHEYRNGVRVEETARFRKFNSLEEGLEEYAMFFTKNKRYSEALKYPNDPYKFIEEIKKAGYATSPTYVSKLHGMLRKYFPNG